MRSYIKIITLSLILVLFATLFPKQGKAQQEDVSLQVFYDLLSPYGQWVDYSNYGYVWIPDVGSDFVPYSTAGHWVLTDYGWTWMSDYDWGWAPFHYGRWNFDDFYGWFWVPDTEWGPAWVTWRSADGYYGWAPMESGISMNLSFGRPFDLYNDHWLFVRNRDIERSDLSLYYANQNDRGTIILNSRVINQTYFDKNRNTTYISGPAREDVQRATGRTLKSISVQENDRPGQSMINGQLSIYRPQVNKTNNGGMQPAPFKIIDIKDVKRISERIQINQPRNENPSINNRQGQLQNNANPRLINQQPTVPQNSNPSFPDRRQQPQKTVIPQGNNPRPVVPQTANPSVPERRQQPQRTIIPQGNNPRPMAPQTANPSTPDRRQQPQRIVNQQNNNNTPRSVGPQNVVTSPNDRRQQPQNVITPQNNNNAKPAVPQNTKSTGNNKSVQQRGAKPSNIKKQQPTQVNPTEEVKKP